MPRLAASARSDSTGHHPEGAPVVFVVDDDPYVREALRLLIGSAGWRALTFTSAEEFLDWPRATVPGCLVLDVALADLNGPELQTLLAEQPELPVIFMASVADIPMIVRAIKAGAVEFLMKPFADEALLSAIRHALDTSRAQLASQAKLHTLKRRHASLTAREKEVMALVVAGLLNKQVGIDLGISEITVKAHRASVMRKMDADSLPALVRMAAMLGLTPPVRVPTLHVNDVGRSMRPVYGVL